jgi:brefeldin A-inhibited guanine nucleotide-exchange protein
VIDTICGCFVSAKTEPAVQLQVIKVLLTAVTSPACEVHESALLRAVQTCFNIFLFSRVPTNQVCCRCCCCCFCCYCCCCGGCGCVLGWRGGRTP